MTVRRWAGLALLLGGVAGAGSGANAQTQLPGGLQRNPAVNPDRINEEQRRRLEERTDPALATPARPTVEAPPPADPAAAGSEEVRFTLQALQIGPSAYLPQAELDALARPLVGREVSLAELQGVADAVNRLYAARGLTTARAVLPAQQVENGSVRIQLVEGRVGAVSVEGGSPRGRRYAGRYGALPADALAAPSAVEGQLRLFNRNNDAQLSARLQPGATLGATDVVLNVAQPPTLSADVFLDNNGFASTGTFELGAVLRGYRLFSDADRASLALVASRGVRSGSANVSTPLGERFRVGASLSYGRTRVLFGPVAVLDVSGTSLSFGADAAALLIAGDRVTLSATAGMQTSLSRTAVAGQRVIANDAVTTTIGVVGSYAVPGFGLSVQHQIGYTHIRETLSGSLAQPVLFQGAASVAKALTPRISARLRADWQLASRDNLPGVVQYQIGGARSSRAFEPGVAGGDSGLSASGELAYVTRAGPFDLEPFALVDHARVSAPGAVSSASSVGAGVALNWAAGIAVRGTVATAFERRGPLADGTQAFVSATFRF